MHNVGRAAAALTAAIVIVFGVGPMGSLLAQDAVPRIGTVELKKLYDAGKVVVIDVRSAAAYANSHVTNALSIPLDGIEPQAASLKKTGKIVVAYCT